MELDKGPFGSVHEEIRAWMSFVDILSRVLVVSTESKGQYMPARIGYRPGADHIAEALLDTENAEYENSSGLRLIYEDLLARGDSSSNEGIAAVIWNLFRSSVFDDCERVAFIIALSVDLNRKYEQIFDHLSGDGSGTGRPTVGLILDMCRLFLPEEDCKVTGLLNDDSLFRRLITCNTAYHGSMMGEEIRLRKSVIMLLMGSEDELVKASGVIGYLRAADTHAKVIAGNVLEDLRRIAKGSAKAVIHLRAPKGMGRSFLVSRLAAEEGLGVIRIHLPMLLSMKQDLIRDTLEEIALKHLLFSDMIYLEADDLASLDTVKLQQAIQILQQYVFKIYIGADGRIPDEILTEGSVFNIPVNRPTRAKQKIIWEELAEAAGISYAPDVSLDEVVSKFNLTPGQIEQALNCCSVLYAGRKDGAQPGDDHEIPQLTGPQIEEQLRSLSGEKLGTLAKKLNATFGINDIQLRDDTRTLVDQVLSRIRHRSTVNDAYGFAAKLPYGRGVSVVLYGPPGTGKTMLACVMAHELGLDLYRVDTSEIGSKYIGETEKNLSALFDAARGSNGILFFDEADALFAKRTDVESSNDKHANSEVAFLLQQIEEYDGLSILATNAVHNFDAAFKRRMTYMISVDRPDEEERLQLWQHVFPDKTPLDKDVNFELYARVDGMTGSSIKAAAVTAAYFAAAEGRAVTNADIIEAIDAEYRKAGNMSGIKQNLQSGML